MAKKKLSKKRRIFNLLKPFKPPATAWDKIYDWLINKARVIMVVAEVFVVISFVGKVVVDIQAKNLTEGIEAAKWSLGQTSTRHESTLRKIQQKSDSYAKLWNSSSGYVEVLREVHSYIPESSSEFIVRVYSGGVTVRGGSSIEQLKQIEAKLAQSPTFVSVTPGVSAESSEILAGEGQYSFTARVNENPTREPIGPKK